ncbi:hypothetical protein F940_01880 [Acinetobacter radioresistens NIPH 2130]|nr:hypothetical protein F940_01880 [Acinetobacter radioresistens NIPH 2130]
MLEFLSLRTRTEIMSTWQKKSSVPLVSIWCTTYNHENYIEDAIKGFLIQETNFSFEIIIHDDASTDKTVDIIRKYERYYPKLIKPIFQKENQYSKGSNFLEILMKLANGKYIAICEGDDYWTDPNKLQKQVDYLETHPNTVISFFNTQYFYQDKQKFGELYLPSKHRKDFSKDELTKITTWLPTSTRVFRKISFGNIPEIAKVLNTDDFLISILGSYGKAHYHHDIKPTVYRVHSHGIWQSQNKKSRVEAQMNTFFWLYIYYQRIENIELSDFFLKKYKYSFALRFTFFEIFKILILSSSPEAVLLRNHDSKLGKIIYNYLRKLFRNNNS